jgi:hypothetical protein
MSVNKFLHHVSLHARTQMEVVFAHAQLALFSTLMESVVVIWMSVQQDDMYVSMNVSIHKAVTNVHVQKATIRLETNVQVSGMSKMQAYVHVIFR